MSLIKKHVDTIIILGGILSAVLWMNSKFNSLERDMDIMKTVLIMKDMMPKELASGR